jgi:metal-responsive CopG/Arc/MetJ family transcriptional regulator
MKVIQVPMDEKLLQAVNRKARASRSTRAALIRAACQEYLHELEEQELEQRYIEGYRRKQEKPQEGQMGGRLAAEVLQEEWDETR